jgi:hypothetical protein
MVNRNIDWPPPKPQHHCYCNSWLAKPCSCGAVSPKIVCEDCEKLGIIIDNRAEEGYKYCWLCLQARKIELQEKRRNQSWLAKLWQEPLHEAMEIFFEDAKLKKPKLNPTYTVRTTEAQTVSCFSGEREVVARITVTTRYGDADMSSEVIITDKRTAEQKLIKITDAHKNFEDSKKTIVRAIAEMKNR